MSVARKGFVLIVAVALLALTAGRPRPAHALNDWVIAGIGVASYAVLVITLTIVVFGGQAAPLTDEEGGAPLEKDREPGTVRFATDCRSTDGNVPIACW